MRPVRPISIAAVAVAAVAALAAGASYAAGVGSAWSRISGPAQAGAQLGLARTGDGVLHVIWNRGSAPTSIFETRLSAAGKPVGTSTVAKGWNGYGGLSLVVMPDRTLRLFAPARAGSTRSRRRQAEVAGAFRAAPAGAARSPSPPM